MANVPAKQTAARAITGLPRRREQGRGVRIRIYVHKRVTLTEKDDVPGQTEKMRETRFHLGPILHFAVRTEFLLCFMSPVGDRGGRAEAGEPG